MARRRLTGCSPAFTSMSLDGDILFVYAKDEEIAAEVEDNFSLHIQIIAAKILKREINIVMVLPKQFVY